MREYLQINGKLRKNLRNLICFELIYRTAVLILIVKSVRLVFSYALKQRGYSYLTAENYFDFIKAPFTGGMIVLFGVVLLVLLFYELCAVTEGSLYGYGGRKMGIQEICSGGFRVFLLRIRKNPVSCLAASAMTGLLVSAPLVIRGVMEIKILKYAAVQIGRWGKDKIFFWCLAVILLVFLVCAMYAIPVLLFEETNGVEAFRRSTGMVLRHKAVSLGAAALCNGIILLGMLGLYYLLLFGAAVYVFVAKETHLAMTTLFALSDGIRMTAGFLAGMIGIACNMQLLTGLYLELEGTGNWKAHIEELPELKKSGKGVAGLLFLAAVEGVFLCMMVSGGMKMGGRLYEGTLVTAHRGGARLAPENTLCALEAAIAHESDYAEVDVQETKDGILILLHDGSFRRTAGVNQKVWETELREVRSMDAGSRFGPEFAGEGIPTLREVLELCRDRLNLNIEVKSNGRNEEIAQKTAELIAELGMEQQCMISSMNYGYLRQVKEEYPAIRTGYIMNMTYGRVELLEYADFLSVESDCVDERFVERAHEAGKEVHVWTVNSRKEMRRMKALGVDNIISDRPGVVREVLMEDKSGAGFLELLRFGLE